MTFAARLSAVPNTLRYILRHPVGRRQPLRTLGRILSWQLGSRLRPGLHPHPWVGGSTLLAARGMTGVTGNLYYGLHEFVEMAFVAMTLRPGDLFADVGANAGTYTILASAVAGAESVPFEPDESIRSVLERQLDANRIRDRVTLRREAVGAHEGEVVFSVGLGPMNRVLDGGEQGVAVPMTTLDRAFADRAPFVMKLDIEGGEAAAIAGAKSILASPSLQALLIETVDDGIAAALAEAGLVERSFDPFTRRLGDPPGDLPVNNRIFVRDPVMIQARLDDAPMLDVVGIRLSRDGSR